MGQNACSSFTKWLWVFFFLGDSWVRKNAENHENQEFDVCLRRHISSFTGGSAVMFGSLQRLWVFIVCSLFTKRVLVWKVVPDHFEIHEIVEKVILDLCTEIVTWKHHEGGKIKSTTESSDADVVRNAVRFACKHSTCTASIEDAQRCAICARAVAKLRQERASTQSDGTWFYYNF